ncbi:MAG: CoA-acylating methylmalonate-semialdehyde dehydrogenase [Deltaproteobacteria bacterium]|nr:MAG: CoA-acylating methylmalonate-semialdehyde dehydrogenase [Deltaproteobacteria bacterium]
MLPSFSASSYDFTEYVPAKNFIGGQWRDPSGAEEQPVLNPRHGKAMASVRFSNAGDIDAAVQAAKTAVSEWAGLPLRERAQILYKARELMLRDLEELSWLVSHENGKLYDEARAEVLKGIECVEYGCSLPNIASGNELEVSRGVTCRLEYAPLGVVAGITPFNFPFMVPLWMIPQALVGGNAFILKPSEQVPLSALKLVEIFREAGLPDGVLQVVQGGREAVEALCDHPGIAALAFVGSTRVAKLVYGRACATGKRALCLGGAKNHLVIVPDADPEVTIENVVASFTGCAGQRCMAASVLMAVGDVDHLIDGIRERAARMVVGQDIGPINLAQSVERIETYIAQAEQLGAKVILDGRGKKATDGGYWVGPTLIDGVTPEVPAGTEEIFGPVLSIMRVPNLEAALQIENANPYGNASSIYTTSGDVAAKIMGHVEAGMCGVNVGVPVPREPFGFGGWNDSKFGHGNITGWDGYRFWTRQRKITTKWALQKDQTWMS